MRRVYLILAVIGFILPYYFFISFLLEFGLDFQVFINQLFVNAISTFFAVDVIITAVVLIIFINNEGKRYRIERRWFYILATLIVGPSFALPLFLFTRENHIDRLEF